MSAVKLACEFCGQELPEACDCCEKQYRTAYAEPVDWPHYPVRPEMAHDMPHRIKCLRVDERGYPIPWFVPYFKGKPEPRMADGGKARLAGRGTICWVCGQSLGRYKTFVIGPMCTVNRVSAEPPSHLECAEFSVKHCPFLSKPRMHRRENDLPPGSDVTGEKQPGFMIKRNPGCVCLWTFQDSGKDRTSRIQRILTPTGFLFQIPVPPSAVSWWAEGRKATRAEVEESVRTGLPILEEMVRSQPEMDQLQRQLKECKQYWPNK
jgi:hypothetical protein